VGINSEISVYAKGNSNVEKRRELCQVLIEAELQNYSVIDIWKAQEIYTLGYNKTLEVMKAYLKKV
jgi:NTE family protein